MKRLFFLLVAIGASAMGLAAQPAEPAAPPGPAPGGFAPPRFNANYPMPYAPASVAQITEVLTRIHGYLDVVTPPRLVDRQTNQEITDYSKPSPGATVARGDFLLTSYEWGVTYAGMLHAGEVTGDRRFLDYTGRRLKFVADIAPLFRAQLAASTGGTAGGGRGGLALRGVLSPRSLDDSGAMCAAMLKATALGVGGELRPLIDNYIDFISNKQFRFADGTLARNRPLANALWLDDLFMSVPALAQMGKLTGERRYYDDAARQILQFGDRMFVREKNLWMHGWIQGMEPHPTFFWGRCNGWAVMAMTELLDVLPEDHPQRAKILELYRAHVRGIVATQSGEGLWHQLLDRGDSYLEISASAIFVYCIARGIDRGWLDAMAYGPVASLGWNAVARKVSEKGQVEGVCVGTGMAFDPAFYYFRPTSPLAAHGYGPVLLAGAEMIAFRKGVGAEAQLSDGAVMMKKSPSNF